MSMTQEKKTYVIECKQTNVEHIIAKQNLIISLFSWIE